MPPAKSSKPSDDLGASLRAAPVSSSGSSSSLSKSAKSTPAKAAATSAKTAAATPASTPEFTGIRVASKDVGEAGDLQESLRDVNNFVMAMMAMIPPKNYLVDKSEKEWRNKFQMSESEKIAKSIDKIEQKKMHQLIAFDPEIQDELNLPLIMRAKAEEGSGSDYDVEDDDDDDDDDDEEDEDGDDEEDEVGDDDEDGLFKEDEVDDDGQEEEEENDSNDDDDDDSDDDEQLGERKTLSRTKEELREKLRQTINKFREARGAVQLDQELPEQQKKKVAERRAKLAEKKKLTKRKRKMSLKSNARASQKRERSDTAAAADGASNQSAAAAQGSGDRAQKRQRGQQAAGDKKPSITFGAIDFSSGTPVPTYLAAKNKHTNQYLLEKAVAEKRALQESLQKPGAQTTVSKQLWDKALLKAQGKKIKDDPTLLRKTIRRQNSLKRRSSRKWDERLEETKKAAADRQAKRQANIDKRLQARKQVREAQRKGVSKGALKKLRDGLKKTQKPKKRPGFEGKNVSKTPPKPQKK